MAPVNTLDPASERILLDNRSDELMTEVHVVTPACTVLRGVDAILYVARAIPWARPLCIVARVPGVLPVSDEADGAPRRQAKPVRRCRSTVCCCRATQIAGLRPAPAAYEAAPQAEEPGLA